MRKEYIFNSVNDKKIIFDVETTGLDVEYNYIAQLSYIIVGSENQVAKNFFFTVPKMERGAEEVHGLSQDKLKIFSKGNTFKDYADEILKDFKDCGLCIGHNVSFDLKFIKKEFERLGINIKYIKEKVYCTMHEYTNILKLNNKTYKGYKWPKLEEVINFLNIDKENLLNTTKEIFKVPIDEEFNGYHDSRFDVICTYKIYFIKEEYNKKIDNINDINIVILDIETTGDNQFIDEICQMSYIILNKKLDIIKAKNYFFEVDHVHFKSNKKKLNKEELKYLSKYRTFKDFYDEIFNDLNNNLIVCHNCKHDISFLKNEFIRVNNKKDFRYEEFCTMEHYKGILKIPSENYKYKYPKLIEIMPYLNIKRSNINLNSKKVFNLKDEEIQFHDSRVDAVSTYLIAIKTPELIDKYKELQNKYIDFLYEDEKYSKELIKEKLQNNYEKPILFDKEDILISKNRNSKKHRILRIIATVLCLFAIIYFYLENKTDNDIIDIVSNYQCDEFNVNEIIESTVTHLRTPYGWHVEKVDKDTYFVYYEFDYDDDINNGSNIIAYEYNKSTNNVNPVTGDLAEKYVDLGYLDNNRAMLINNMQVFNTTYYTYDDRELRRSYTIDKELAYDNYKINTELYGDFKKDFYNKESFITGGRSKETVFIIKEENTFHRDINCSELHGEDMLFRVFYQDAESENRVLCEHER